MSTVPPAMPKTDTPFRKISVSPQLGDEVGLFKVVECTPDSLRLSVPAGWMIFLGFLSIIIALIAFAIFWFMPKSDQTSVSNFSGNVFAVALLAGLAGPLMLAHIGHSMDVDRIRRLVRVTWLYLRAREHPANRFKTVVLEIEKPSEASPAKGKSGGASPPPRFANSVKGFIEGTDELGRPLQIKLGDSVLWSKDGWPSLASTAIHVSKVLRLPLRIDGAVDRLSPTAVQQFAAIAMLAGKLQ